LTADISHQDIAIEVKHLVLEELRGKHAVLIHGDLSLTHYDGSLLVGLDVKLESLFLKLLNHGDVSDFEVSNAQLEHFELLS
jgi:hypothetical protein